jgi:FkbM family methyltransferase
MMTLSQTDKQILYSGIFNEVGNCRRGLMLYNKNDMYIGRSLQKYGEFSEHEMELLLKLVQPGDLVVEAGANIGTHTLALSQAVGPSGMVIAYEPQRLVFQSLCANLALNSIANVVARQAALGARPEVARIPALNPYKHANFGGVSISDHSQSEPVSIESLDSLGLSRCSLIKIDVEGYEIQVLNGSRETIQRLRPVLYVENDRAEKSAALIALIQGYGYRLWWHLPPLFNARNYRGDAENIFDRIVSVNMLCLPAEIEHPMELREVTGPDDTWQNPY